MPGKSNIMPSGTPHLAAPEMFYADQIAQMQIGPYVSKLTFGLDDGVPNVTPRPSVTVVIPTQALLQMAHTAHDIIGGDKMRDALEEQHKSFKRDIAAIPGK